MDADMNRDESIQSDYVTNLRKGRGMSKNDIIRLAREAGIAHHGLGWTCWEGQLERFAALVAAAEREACAKVCETGVDYPHPTVKGVILKNFGGSTLLAAAIRARSKA